MEKRFKLLVPLLLIVFISISLILLATNLYSQNPTGAMAIPCPNPPCESDNGQGDNGDTGSGNGPPPPGLCPGENFLPNQTKRCVEPGWESKNDSFIEINNIPYCCFDPTTEFCNQGECQPIAQCPKASNRPDQTTLCRAQGTEGKAEEELGPDEYCCYNAETESCRNGSCSLCPAASDGTDLEYCEAPSALDKARKDLVKGNDYCCFDPSNQKCYKGNCITACQDKKQTIQGVNGSPLKINALEKTCFARDSSGKLNAWCCPLNAAMPANSTSFCGNPVSGSSSVSVMGICDHSFESNMTASVFNPQTKSWSEKTFQGCRAVSQYVTPKELLCEKNSGIYGINILCLDSEEGCPVCNDGRKPRLFVLWGSIIWGTRKLSALQSGSLTLKQCAVMDDDEHCVFLAGVKNELDFQKIVTNYSRCFSDIGVFAHGCPGGFGEGSFFFGTKDQGENVGSLLDQSNPGQITAISCGLLYSESGNPPLFVQSACKVAPEGTKINGSTQFIGFNEGIGGEVTSCEAVETCWECDGKGGSRKSENCGDLFQSITTYNNAYAGTWKKSLLGLGWIWCPSPN